MGSTGSGNFTDYGSYSGGNPKQGGETKENECEKAFRTELEDVDTSEYFTSKERLPVINTEIAIEFNGHRIVATIDGREIGNLPTKYNYLRKCMNDYTYSGIVSNTSSNLINSITINVFPNV
ncbi:MAG: hypothetical protein U5L09_06555 [Bacteroidales bacterium]|nr:hypothetical protein [Bacteroidales bacterium]